MSRQFDIRVALVGIYHDVTIADLSKIVGMIKALVKAQENTETRVLHFECPEFVHGKNKSPKLVIGLIPERNKIILNGKDFPITGLMNFATSLEVMAGPMGMGNFTFATLYQSDYNELKSLGLTDKEIATLNAYIFSGIMKRFYNLARPGSDAPYHFKIKLSLSDRPIGLTMVEHSFQDNATVRYRIESNNAKLDKSLNWFHEEYIPTPQAVSKLIGSRIKSGWSFAENIDEPINIAKSFLGLVKAAIKDPSRNTEVVEDFCKFVRSIENHRDYKFKGDGCPISFVTDYGNWVFSKCPNEGPRSSKIFDIWFRPLVGDHCVGLPKVCLNELHDAMNMIYGSGWKVHNFLSNDFKKKNGDFPEFLERCGLNHPQSIIDLLDMQMKRLNDLGDKAYYEEWGCDIKFEVISGDEDAGYEFPVILRIVINSNNETYHSDKVFLKRDISDMIDRPNKEKPSLLKRFFSIFSK